MIFSEVWKDDLNYKLYGPSIFLSAVQPFWTIYFVVISSDDSKSW